MGYDPNGFNFQGESVLNTYNTDVTGETIPTKSSGFSKNSTDIAKLITPAITGGRGTTDIGNAYKGFSGQITFDNAFSSQAPENPLLTLSQSTPGSYFNPWNSVEFKNPDYDGWFKVTFSKTLSNGSASTPNDFYIPDVSMILQVVGGGGSGGSTGTVQGAGGGGAGGVHELDIRVYADSKIINVKVGSGGSSVGGHARGNHGNLTRVWGTTNNDFYIEAVGGGGGGYFDGNGYRTNPGASTGGAGASASGISYSKYADALTTNGNTITRYGNNAGVKIISETDLGRNIGGSDPHGTGGWSGGGGGGAGGGGGNGGGYQGRYGGDGGAGVVSYGKTYGGGGGGRGEYHSAFAHHGSGGSGIGGNGGQPGGNGTANTGSGGGAGWGNSGTGGSGVVRLLYKTSQVRTS